MTLNGLAAMVIVFFVILGLVLIFLVYAIGTLDEKLDQIEQRLGREREAER